MFHHKISPAKRKRKTKNMLSPEILRIILLLSLFATGYVLVLNWNEDSEVNSQKQDSYSEVPLPKVTQPIPYKKIPETFIEKSSTNDIPDQSFLVTETSNSIFSDQTSTNINPSDRLVRIDTPTIQVWIDLMGGDIVRVNLPKYPRKIDEPDSPLYLLTQNQQLDHIYIAQSGLIGPDGPDSKAARPLYSSSQSYYKLQPGDQKQVTLYFDSSTANIEKTFNFSSDQYLIEVNHTARNKKAEAFKAGVFAQIKRDNKQPPEQKQSMLGMQAYVGAAFTTPEEKYLKTTFDDIDEEQLDITTQGGWVAFLQHYFLVAWIPDQEVRNRYTARKLNDEKYVFGFTGPLVTLAPGEEFTWKTRFYAGPKDQNRLAEISPNLNLTVDYGFLFFIAEPLFWLLNTLHDFSGNWGLAIILLTVVVKLVLYPLSAAGYRSMANMRRVAPQLKKLQERYSNDREKLQKAMMDLYKRENANPLGGCLPMILPMPIFIALYWVLLEAVELRHAPFMFWIEDLAVMDPYFILPILMCSSMYLMQLLNPQVGDPMQVKMMKMMPIIFGVLFLWFPAGLVLYWCVNNLLSLAQQWYVIKQTDKLQQSKTRG